MKAKKRLSRLLFILLLAAFAVLSALYALRAGHERRARQRLWEDMLAVTFLDVGQGDACFIRSPNGKTMLIDCGPTDSSPTVLHELAYAGVGTVDVVLLSHPHEDHVGGFEAVLRAHGVGMLLFHAALADVYPFSVYAEEAAAIGTAVHGTRAGERFMFDDCVGVEVLYPETADRDDGNESSLCVRLTYGKCTFLFPGDAESMAEKTMLGSGVNLDADVLKVAHHGSSTSCSAAFVDAVSPDAAVISVGKDNNYGHPSGKTLSTFAARGIPVWRTDENGSVTFLSDGERIYLASSDGGDELALKAA